MWLSSSPGVIGGLGCVAHMQCPYFADGLDMRNILGKPHARNTSDLGRWTRWFCIHHSNRVGETISIWTMKPCWDGS